ncbi:Zn-finger nucleic acid-binding protein [Paraburkholderia sp. 40]
MMKCPVCKTTDLLMTERRSIEIDYCPDCRGVWLDRGELDKLIAQDDGDGSRRGERAQESERQRYEERRDEHRGYQKKRAIFDVFDFD